MLLNIVVVSLCTIMVSAPVAPVIGSQNNLERVSVVDSNRLLYRTMTEEIDNLRKTVSEQRIFIDRLTQMVEHSNKYVQMVEQSRDEALMSVIETNRTFAAYRKRAEEQIALMRPKWSDYDRQGESFLKMLNRWKTCLKEADQARADRLKISAFQIYVVLFCLGLYIVHFVVCKVETVVKNKWFKPKVEVTKFIYPEEHGTVEGSVYMNETPAKYQFQIWQVSENDPTECIYRGAASYVDDYFVTARHVVAELNGQECIFRRSEDLVGVRKKITWNLLDIDVAFIKADSRMSSALGLTKVKSTTLSRPTIVEIRAMGQKTIGELVLSGTSFGGVNYMGSCRRGFSGALYVQGSKALGMHVGSCKHGFGFDIQYILSCIGKTKVQLHSTEDYLVDFVLSRARRGKKTKFSNAAPGEIQLRDSDGKYFTIDIQDISKEIWENLEPVQLGSSVYENHSYGPISYKDTDAAPLAVKEKEDVVVRGAQRVPIDKIIESDDDTVDEPKNSNSPPQDDSVGAIGNLDDVIDVLNQMQFQLDSLSEELCQARAQTGTAGHSSTHVQQSDPLPNTSSLSIGKIKSQTPQKKKRSKTISKSFQSPAVSQLMSQV